MMPHEVCGRWRDWWIIPSEAPFVYHIRTILWKESLKWTSKLHAQNEGRVIPQVNAPEYGILRPLPLKLFIPPFLHSRMNGEGFEGGTLQKILDFTAI